MRELFLKNIQSINQGPVTFTPVSQRFAVILPLPNQRFTSVAAIV